MERDPKDIIRELQARLEEEHRGRLQERQGRLAAESVTQKTALVPFLINCYQILQQPVSVQRVSTLRSSGGFTDIKERCYPRELRPWSNFTQLHDDAFGELAALFGGDALFPSKFVIEHVRRSLSSSPLANEEDLRPLEMLAIELQAKNIIVEYLARKPQDTARVVFRSNSYSLRRHGDMETSHDASPAQSPSRSQRRGSSRGRSRGRRRAGSRGGSRDQSSERGRSQARAQARPAVASPTTSAHRSDFVSKRQATSPPPGSPEEGSAKRSSSQQRRSVPDRWCIAENKEHVRRSLFTIEYKAAHKAMPDTLASVLDGRSSDMALFADAAETKRRAEEKSPRSNLGQVVSVEEDDGAGMDTVVAAASGARAADSPSRSSKAMRNRIAQILIQEYHYMVDHGLAYGYITTGESFIFLYVDFADDPSVLYYRLLVPKKEITLPLMQDGEGAGQQQTEQHVAGIAKQTPIAHVVTLILLALQSALLGFEEKERVKTLVKVFPEPYGTSTEQAGQGEGPGQSATQAPVAQQASSQGGQGSGSIPIHTARAPQPAYCTQACLLGLRFGQPADPACPNAALHAPADKKGPAYCEKLLSVLKEQLAANLDDGCVALDGHGKFGAIGALFKVTVYPHGYTFVAKGVQSDDRYRLDWEERVYQQLTALQGSVVPVCLGLVDLRRAYVLASGARVVRLMLLSYAGETARPDQVDDEAVMTGLDKVLQAHGVEHGDLRRANVLWSEKQQRLMVVDFDRAQQRAKRKRGADAGGLAIKSEARHDGDIQ